MTGTSSLMGLRRGPTVRVTVRSGALDIFVRHDIGMQEYLGVQQFAIETEAFHKPVQPLLQNGAENFFVDAT